LTASLAPGLRGAEPAIDTTVATATRSPRSRQRSISCNTSRIANLHFYPLLRRLWRKEKGAKPLLLLACFRPFRNRLTPSGSTAFWPAIIDCRQKITQVDQAIQVMGWQKIIN